MEIPHGAGADTRCRIQQPGGREGGHLRQTREEMPQPGLHLQQPASARFIRDALHHTGHLHALHIRCAIHELRQRHYARRRQHLLAQHAQTARHDDRRKGPCIQHPIDLDLRTLMQRAQRLVRPRPNFIAPRLRDRHVNTRRLIFHAKRREHLLLPFLRARESVTDHGDDSAHPHRRLPGRFGAGNGHQVRDARVQNLLREQPKSRDPRADEPAQNERRSFALRQLGGWSGGCRNCRRS